MTIPTPPPQPALHEAPASLGLAPRPPLRLAGARVLRGGVIGPGEVLIAQGLIAEPDGLPAGRGEAPARGGGRARRSDGGTERRTDARARAALAPSAQGLPAAGYAEVDLTGYLVLPGIVDLCGGGFERHLTPGPRAALPFEAALLATDREAAAHGVTTAHLSQGWSWEGGRRDPDRAEALLAALEAHRARALIDLRAVLRVETHTVGTGARLIDLVSRHRVGCALFGDRLTGSGLSGPARFAAAAARAAALEVAPEDHAARARAAAARAQEVPRHVLGLIEAFEAMGVVTGSAGDRDGEAREAWSMRGARLCAFPAARAPAASARAVGDPVVLHAPEAAGYVARGARAIAPDLIAGGLCDALASGAAYPALARAAFGLADQGVMPLAQAWALVAETPARLLRLADRGRIAPGLRADLCVIDEATRLVEATICGGRIAYLAGAAAARFLAAAPAPAPASAPAA